METREAFVWQEQAACAEGDTDLFFDDERQTEAKAVCATCPVQKQCLAANLSLRFGVFGGTTPEEREKLGGANEPMATDFITDSRGCVIDEGVADPDNSNDRYLSDGVFHAGTPEGKRAIREMVRRYDEGETLQQIADSLGVCNATVCRYVNKHSRTRTKTEANKMRSKAKQADYEETVRLYRDTEMGQRAIARHLGISDHMVRKYVREAGLPVKGISYTAQKKAMMEARGYGDEETMTIVRKIKDGVPASRISRDIGCSLHRVYNIRKSVAKGVY